MSRRGLTGAGGIARGVTRRFYLATGLLVLLFLVSGGLLLAYLGHSLDRQSAAQAGHLARTALQQLEASDRSHVYDFALWDDTVAFTRGEKDRVWADNNIGPWSMETYGFEAAFVVGTDDRLLYAVVDRSGGGGEIAPLPPAELLGSEVWRLVEAARLAPMDEPTPASAFFWQPEGIRLGVAAAITPEYPGAAELERRPRPVLLYARRLGEAALSDLSERYLLPGLRLAPSSGTSLPDRLALRGADGAAVADLVWNPPRPSIDALGRAVWPVAFVLLLLAVLSGGIVVTARRAGRTIAGTVEALERSNEELTLRERAARAARDEAEQASRVKTVFFANVSHELRTPLNAILGFSEILRHQLKGPLGHPAYREYVDDIRASGEHLLRLIDNVIDLSRIEVGAWDLTPATMDLRETTEEVLRFLQPLARDRGVALEVELSSTPRAFVADARAVAQIVTNLIGNAIKFTDAGGRVRVRWCGSDDGSAVLRVSDTGIGISAADIEAITTPFSRGRDPAARRRDGSGLGLSIVKSLVELHDGRLEIDSAPGKGTRITVTLPDSQEAVAA